jgi:cholestenol delta-isomerase
MPSFVPLLLLTVGAAVLAWRLRRERLVTFWLLWSGLIHLVMEASYGLFHDVVTTASTTTFNEFMAKPASIGSWFDPRWWANIYSQYARYDARYVEHDPVILFICYSELVLGPLCFLLVYLIHRESRLRHPVQILLCTAQIYGTALYLLAPVIQGSWDRVMTHDTGELFQFVIGTNAMWIVIPGIMLTQSLRRACTLRS